MAIVQDWARYPNFKKAEFDCKETGENAMQAEFMEKLQALRSAFGKSMPVTSGYRSPKHPVEMAKGQPGTHSLGMAADIAVTGQDAYRLLALAIDLGFTGVGVSQRAGKARFIHLDACASSGGIVRPMIWSY